MKPEVIYTYDAVWGLKRMFYHIERFRLPVPVSVSEILILFLFEGLAIYLTMSTNWFDTIPWAIRFILIPFGAAWLLSRMDLEGRPPYQYFYSLITHTFTVKEWSRGVPLEKEKQEMTHRLTKLVGGVKNYATTTNTDR